MAVMYVQVVDAAQPGLAALEQGRLNEARTLLEGTVQQQARHGRAWAALALTYARLGQPEPAAAAAVKAEALAAQSPETQHALALYYAQTGNRVRAAELERLYAASPQADPAAAARAALLSAEVRHWPQAIEFGRKALERGQRTDILLPMLVAAYEATGQPGNALEMRRRFSETSPHSEDAQSGYGVALLRAARFRDAVEQLERARRSFDKSPQIELALGTAYYAQRRFADAAGSFLRVIDLDNSVAQPYIFLARMIGQIPERAPEFLARAKAWYESGEKNAFAPFVYARALAASGAADDAIRPLLDEAIRRDAGVWDFHFDLGQLLERARDYPRAARAYETSAACARERPEPHYRLSRVYDRLGRGADARRHREIHAALMRKEQQRAGVIEP